MPGLNILDFIPEIQRYLAPLLSHDRAYDWIVTDAASSSHCMVPQPNNIFTLAMPHALGPFKPLRIRFSFSYTYRDRIPDFEFLDEDLKELYWLFMYTDITRVWRPKSDPRSLLNLVFEIQKTLKKHADDKWRENLALLDAFKEMLREINPPGADPLSEEMVTIKVMNKKLILTIAFPELKGSVKVIIPDRETFPNSPARYELNLLPWFNNLLKPASFSQLRDAMKSVNESKTTLAGAVRFLRDALKAEHDSVCGRGQIRKAFVEALESKLDGFITYDRETFKDVQVHTDSGVYVLKLSDSFPDGENPLWGCKLNEAEPLQGLSLGPRRRRTASPEELADSIVRYFEVFE